jgi:Protein of unknown function (DUF664)
VPAWSQTTLGGLVKHLAAVKREWILREQTDGATEFDG